MALGHRFQARVTTWWAARILLQTPTVGQHFNLSVISIAERIYCETTDSVNDLRVELTGNGQIFGQCKTSLSLSKSAESEWASVLIQFYNELERVPLEGVERRFVLFYENNNGNLEKLNTVLSRYRQLPVGTALIDAAIGKKETEFVDDLNTLLDTLQLKTELPNLATRREELLRHSYIKQLRLGDGEADYLGVVDALREGLLTSAEQTNNVVKSMRTLADDLLAERGSTNRLTLRQRLQGEGIILRDSIHYRLDFERLEKWSAEEIEAHETQGRAKLTIAGHQFPIVRPVVQAMLETAKTNSFLVVGGAGTGKTGCLLALANQLRASNDRVWYWAANSLPYHSSQEIGDYLHLQYSWMGLIAEAASGVGATLIIDGLDGLRDTRALQAYQKLFRIAIYRGIKVIAYIRSFDLQYSVDLQEIFPAPGHSMYPKSCHKELRSVSHILISELDDGEFNQVLNQFPDVQTVLNEAPQIQGVIRNLFSLDILCKLIAEGEPAAQLSGISTQAELFERYWRKRVDSHERRDEITEALKELIGQMVAQQTLQVIPNRRWTTQLKDDLFSPELVRHPRSAPGRLPEQEIVEFNHHLLFDYAAERLFVRRRRNQLAIELSRPDTWGLFLRPSLVLFHGYAWNQGKLDFWETLIELERSSIPVLQKLPGYLVVAEEANCREDLQPLLEGSLRNDSNSAYWMQITQGVITAATFSSLPRLFKSASGDWWIELARDLVQTGKPQLVYANQRLLFSASNALETLSVQAKLFLNQAGVALLQFHWSQATPPSPVTRLPIECICRTIASALSASSKIIRKILSYDELLRAGYIQTFEVVSHIEDIWQADPDLAVEVYDAIFGYVETEQSATAMYPSNILPLKSNRKQDYELAYHILVENFPLFLSEFPREATRALIRVIRHFRNQKDRDYLRFTNTLLVEQASRFLLEQSGLDNSTQQPTDEIEIHSEDRQRKLPPIETITWDGHECRLQSDDSHIWDGKSNFLDDQTKMLHVWSDYLAALPSNSQVEEKWQAISDVVTTENELAAIWRRLLIAASHSSTFYAQRLWTMLLNPEVLIRMETQEVAEDCIKAFAPHLSDEALQQIESVILEISESYFMGSNTETLNNYLLSVKAQLLCCIAKERRSIAAKEFLADCDPKLLQAYQRDYGVRPIPVILTNESFFATPAIDITTAEPQNKLQKYAFLEKLSNAFLEEISTENFTENALTSAWHKIFQVEQVLTESLDEMDSRFASRIQGRITHGLTQIACSQVALNEQCTNKLLERFREILISNTEAPSLELLEQFDRSQSLVTYDLRVHAAKGFICLANKAELLTAEWKDLLHRVTHDPNPVVRYHLGEQIWSFLDKWPEFVWETLERWVSELPSRAGTVGVFCETLHSSWFWWLRNNDATRADQFLRNLLTAVNSCHSTKLRSHCGVCLAALWIFEGETWAGDALSSAISSISDNTDELEGAQRVVVNELLPRSPKEPSPVEQRQRARNFLLQLLSAANQALQAYSAKLANTPRPERPNEPPQWVRKVAEFFHYVATEFHFCAEEHAKQWAEAQASERDTQMMDLWENVEPILDALFAIPHPGVVFDLIKGFEHLVNLDVQRSLHWMRKATLASVPAGLANESLAADRTIEILRRILAEHKTSLAAGDELRSDFVQVLEAYLQVGWPKAVQLAVQIESIFR